MPGGQRLPFEREQAVALQIAERAIVGQYVEAVSGPFEGAARSMTAVGAVSGVGAKNGEAFVSGHPAGDGKELVIRQIGDGVERRSHDLDFAVRVEIGQRDLAARLGL